MVSIIEKIIKLLKKDPNYQFKSSYSNRDFLRIVCLRSIQLFRGFILKIWLNSSGTFIFCGRNVNIEHGYKISVGKSFIIEDFVHINALSEKGISIGDNVTIAKFAVIVCTGVIANKGVGIKIGNNTAIGAQSFIGGQGGIEIGNDVLMGPQVKIFSENHNFENINLLVRQQGESRRGVTIDDNCWIGAGVTILDGVTIGKGCIVAAGSVVTTSIPENSVVAGVPAKILKERN
jgi:acetyltransferase-like isoleucine patch superfamily enzyme